MNLKNLGQLFPICMRFTALVLRPSRSTDLLAQSGVPFFDMYRRRRADYFPIGLVPAGQLTSQVRSLARGRKRRLKLLSAT